MLKGHIALCSAVFPDKTMGGQLDSHARSALWQYGLDYKHGTGHGVGAFLNVHEGPHGIGKTRTDRKPLQAGMFVTDGRQARTSTCECFINPSPSLRAGLL